MDEARVLIAGGGIAGLSAAYHLLKLYGFEDFTLLEAESEVGGTSRSLRTAEGFVFDHGSHALYTGSDYVAALYRKILQDKFLELERDAWIYSKGRLTRFPFQAKLNGLPFAVIAECIWGYMRADRSQAHAAAHFAEWLDLSFGDGIVRHFMAPFNKKHWKYPLDQMAHRWLSPYVARPSLLNLLRGAFSPDGKKYGANAVFWYPISGGIGAVPDGLLRLLGSHANKVKTNSAIQSISLKGRRVRLHDGRTVRYQRMVYTLPLRALLSLLSDDLPYPVREALERLEYNRQYCLCFGVEDRTLDRWMRLYLPERKFLAHRLGFPQAISTELAPPGWGSVYAEITEPRAPESALSEEQMVTRTLADLAEIGVTEPDDRVEYKGHIVIDPAYVVFTHTHQRDVQVIRGYLAKHDVHTAGRYGDWRYYAIDNTILSAKAAVERLAPGLDG